MQISGARSSIAARGSSSPRPSQTQPTNTSRRRTASAGGWRSARSSAPTPTSARSSICSMPIGPCGPATPVSRADRKRRSPRHSRPAASATLVTMPAVAIFSGCASRRRHPQINTRLCAGEVVSCLGANPGIGVRSSGSKKVCARRASQTDRNVLRQGRQLRARAFSSGLK